MIAPGWVALEAHSTVVPAERRHFGEEMIRKIEGSLRNFVLFFVAILLGHSLEPQSLDDLDVLGAVRLDPVVTSALLAVVVYGLRSFVPR